MCIRDSLCPGRCSQKLAARSLKPPPWYHFPVPNTDTSPAAQAVQLDIHRSMTGEQRLLPVSYTHLFDHVEFVGTSADNPYALETKISVNICRGLKLGTLTQLWPQVKRWH